MREREREHFQLCRLHHRISLASYSQQLPIIGVIHACIHRAFLATLAFTTDTFCRPNKFYSMRDRTTKKRTQEGYRRRQVPRPRPGVHVRLRDGPSRLPRHPGDEVGVSAVPLRQVHRGGHEAGGRARHVGKVPAVSPMPISLNWLLMTHYCELP